MFLLSFCKSFVWIVILLKLIRSSDEVESKKTGICELKTDLARQDKTHLEASRGMNKNLDGKEEFCTENLDARKETHASSFNPDPIARNYEEIESNYEEKEEDEVKVPLLFADKKGFENPKPRDISYKKREPTIRVARSLIFTEKYEPELSKKHPLLTLKEPVKNSFTLTLPESIKARASRNSAPVEANKPEKTEHLKNETTLETASKQNLISLLTSCIYSKVSRLCGYMTYLFKVYVLRKSD